MSGHTPVTEDISTEFLRVNVPENPDATDITFTVQATSNLTDPTSWTTGGTAVDQNTASLLLVHDNAPVGSTSKRFLRWLITR